MLKWHSLHFTTIVVSFNNHATVGEPRTFVVLAWTTNYQTSYGSGKESKFFIPQLHAHGHILAATEKLPRSLQKVKLGMVRKGTKESKLFLAFSVEHITSAFKILLRRV